MYSGNAYSGNAYSSIARQLKQSETNAPRDSLGDYKGGEKDLSMVLKVKEEMCLEEMTQ